MEILAYNFSWMFFNLILSLIPVVLVFTLKGKLNQKIRVILLFLWLIFLPNTIYLITDIQYFVHQFKYLNFPEIVISILMYGFVVAMGIVTYMISLKPFENIISNNKSFKKNKVILYILLNLLLAFAVILGKFQRTHSWYIFTQPLRVANDVYMVLTDLGMLICILLFWIIINIIFFTFKNFFEARK